MNNFDKSKLNKSQENYSKNHKSYNKNQHVGFDDERIMNYKDNNDNYLAFEQTNELPKKEPSYVMTIELEKGKSELIQIFIDSNPDELAFEFCKKNNLNLNAMKFLSSEIKDLLAKITIQSSGCIQEEPEEESVKDKSMNSIQALHENVNEENDEQVQISNKKESYNVNEDFKKNIRNNFSNKKSNTINYSDNLQKFPIDFNTNMNQIDYNFNQNIKNSNKSVIEQRNNFLILKNNDENYKVNKESTVAPVLSSTYPSRRIYDVVNDQSRNGSKNEDPIKNNINHLNKNQFDYESNSNYYNEGESVIENNFNSNHQKQNNLIGEINVDNLLVAGSNKKNNLQVKVNSSHNLQYSNQNDMFESRHYINNNNNNNHKNYKYSFTTNPFKRPKLNESNENIRTEPIEEEVNNSFSSNHSGIKDKMQNIHENKEFDRNYNYKIKNHLNRNNNDFNENSTNHSNTKINNKKISDYTNLGESYQKRNNTSQLFFYENFYNNMKKRTENKKEASTNATNKTSVIEKQDLKRNVDSIIDKLNYTIEREYLNIGERLYQRGLKSKENKAKKLLNIKENMYKNENEHLTFKPAINKSPLFRNTDQAFKTENNYTLANTRFNNSKMKDLNKKTQNNMKNDENYNFSPEIDKKSKEIYQQKFLAKFTNNNLTKEEFRNKRFKDMHERAKIRQNIIKKLDQQIYGNFNFTPNFNTNYIVESTFNERLEYFKTKSEEKKKNIEKEMKKKLEGENGKKFFSPTLISKQIERDSLQNSNIYDYMYSFAKKFNSNKNLKQENQIKQIIENSSSVHTTYDSDVLINKIKHQNFESIFNLLDSDQDNQISKFSIDLKKLPDNLKNILKIITREIIEDNQTLNKEEFMLACEHLYEMLNFEERKILLNFNKELTRRKNDQSSQKFSFKPKINKNSRKIDESLPYYISKSQSNSVVLNNKSFDY